MQLLILRHGKAEDSNPGGDRARALVEKGFDQARRAGEVAKASGMLPDLVLTSPYRRTVETAETFCRAAGLPAPVEQPWLASGMRAEVALTELPGFSKFKRVMIVGHEPDLSSLIEWLLGATGGAVDMKKGCFAGFQLHGSGRRGQLLFFIPPALVEDL